MPARSARRRERTKPGSEHHGGETKDGGQEGARPPSPEVCELRHRSGKDELICVALEIAEDRGSENGGDDDNAEKAAASIIQGVRERTIQKDFPVAGAYGSKAFRGDAEKRER